MYAAQPDLVVLTGDNIFGKYVHGFDETRAAIAEFMDIFQALGVPVAIVFGNHDDDGDALLKDDQLEDIYSEYSVNISYDADRSLDGCGTYNVPIYGSSEREKVKFNLWMFDTGSSINYSALEKADSLYDYMRDNQLRWYKAKSNELRQANGDVPVPSIVFQHIIVKEIYNVLETASANTPGAQKYSKGRYYTLPKKYVEQGSVMGECPSPSRKGNADEKKFQTVKDQKDVIAIVSGHDHRNMFVVPCDGIDLINTPAAGFYETKIAGQIIYQGDDATRGARIIDIYEPGVSDQTKLYTTDMLFLRDTTQPQYFYLPTDTGKYVKNIALCAEDSVNYGGSTQAATAAAYGRLYAAVDAAGGNGVALWADLNAGSDILDLRADNHTVICMGYTLTDNPAEAMRGLGLSYNGDWPTSYDGMTAGGRVWNLCCYHDLTVIGTNSSPSRCNLNAGTEGNPIYFFASYDSAAGSPLTEIRIVNTGRHDPISISAYPGYQLAYAVFGSEIGSDVADLNKSAWGDYIYALYRTSANSSKRVELNTQPLQDARFQAIHQLNTSDTVYPEDCLAKLQSAVAKADAILSDLRGSSTTSVYDQAAIDAATYQIMAWLHIQELKDASRAFTVTFDANDGTCSEQSRTILCGVAVGDLPSASKVLTFKDSPFPKKSSITLKFEGWFTEREGGEQITPETVFTAASDQTWYAHWSGGLTGAVEKPISPRIPVDGDLIASDKDVSDKPSKANNNQVNLKTADVNNDSRIDLKDLTLLRRHLIGGWNVELDLLHGDVNTDGQINLRDVILLQRYIAGGWGIEAA